MPSQLDILAIEGFYGGARRVMLDSLARYSRHRWSIYRLPARRLERRLTAGATWFSEQIARKEQMRVDAIFTSEVINVAELLRLQPQLSNKPTIVYFHDNQLPSAKSPREDPLDFINLNTAMAGTSLWFNSRYHQGEFLNRASALLAKHPELEFLFPVDRMKRKSMVMPPPLDLNMMQRFASTQGVTRVPKAIFIDTRAGDVPLLDQALSRLDYSAGWSLVCLGPHRQLTANLPRTQVNERDFWGQARALLGCGIYLSTRTAAMFDETALRALWAGCRLVVPQISVYPELLAGAQIATVFHDNSPVGVTQALKRAGEEFDSFRAAAESAQVLGPYEALKIVRSVDERLEAMVAPPAPGAGVGLPAV